MPPAIIQGSVSAQEHVNENTSPLLIPLPLDQNAVLRLSEPHGPGLLGEGFTPPSVLPSTHATLHPFSLSLSGPLTPLALGWLGTRIRMEIQAWSHVLRKWQEKMPQRQRQAGRRGLGKILRMASSLHQGLGRKQTVEERLFRLTEEHLEKETNTGCPFRSSECNSTSA